jgi:hypothetical protein
LKPKFIALNVCLIAAIAAIAWQARVRWDALQAQRQSHLRAVIKPAAPPPLKPVPKPDPAAAAKYLDVATQDLFSKDRNPNVVVETPKVEPPKPMPPLPVVFGVMGLPSGTKAIMAEKSGASSRTVHTGDTIGAFKIVALDTQNVTFDWDGKGVSRKIEDLIDRSAAAPTANGQQAAAAAPPAGQAQNNQPAPAPVAAPTSAKDLGVEVGAPGQPSSRACAPGDSSPAGAVVDGYRKTITQSPFGAVCRWEQTK